MERYYRNAPMDFALGAIWALAFVGVSAIEYPFYAEAIENWDKMNDNLKSVVFGVGALGLIPPLVLGYNAARKLVHGTASLIQDYR